MAEEFAKAFSQYWIIIVTVGSGVLAGAAMVYKIAGDFNRSIGILRDRIRDVELTASRVETKVDMLIACNGKEN